VFYPTIVTLAHETPGGQLPPGLVSLRATWTMTSGEQYAVSVPLLSHFAATSLVLLLCAGEISPLALIALSQPI
jgi:hypothetical protein